MDELSITALILAAATLLVAAACHLVRSLSRTGKLPRNHLVGLRTPATLSSDDGWELGHHAAEPLLRSAAQLGFAAAAISVLVVALAQTSGPVSPMVALVLSALGLCGTVAMLLIAGRRANSAAKQVRASLDDLN